MKSWRIILSIVCAAVLLACGTLAGLAEGGQEKPKAQALIE